MFKAMLARLLNAPNWRSRKTKTQPSYAEARDALSAGSKPARLTLAASPDTPPEMLYYLASDPDTSVRAKIAANPNTPPQAYDILAIDSEDSVRAQLTRKIARLMPGLDGGETCQIRDQVTDLLQRLAQDQAVRVRQIMAEELCQSRIAPPDVIRTLAFDRDAAVALPVIEYSPLLNDSDLIELIAAARVDGAVSAIAKRREVSEAVTDEIVASLEIPAIAHLLTNPNARIREETMATIIDQAETAEALHGPLVQRADLSVRAMRRIAGFAAASLVEELAGRTGLDDETARWLRQRVNDRLSAEDTALTEEPAEITAAERVQAAARTGQLDETFLTEAAENGDRPAVIEALAHLAKTDTETVSRILKTRNAKPVTALCWHAGLPMRAALTIQQTVALVPRDEILLAREGVHYPLPEEEMRWHLEYFKIA